MIRFKINGRSYEHDDDPEMPLLWAIRDGMGLTGTKFGCGIGQCGACTVHIDGRAQRSCITAVSSVAGKNITTIEGLSPDGDHPVQRAWISNDVPQCGYCQAGQIMATADLLARNPSPSDDDINREITNICRCGTYVRLRKAIHDAARLMAREA